MIAFSMIIGLITGSFLNVAIFRIPREESVVTPRSHCPACGHVLHTTDMVPVLSYIWLGGRCRYCKARISYRYVMVELLTSGAFAMVVMTNEIPGIALAGWLFASILIMSAFTDIETGLIPNRITYPGMVIGLLLSVFTVGVLNALAGLLLFAGSFLGLALLSKGGLGGGDVKLAGVIGAFLGWQSSITTFVISSLAGGIWAVLLLAAGRVNRKSSMKFGPFLAASAWLVWMLGSDVINSLMQKSL